LNHNDTDVLDGLTLQVIPYSVKASIQITYAVGAQVHEKASDQFTTEEHQRVQKNYRALNTFYYALNANAFNIFSTCELAKEI